MGRKDRTGTEMGKRQSVRKGGGGAKRERGERGVVRVRRERHEVIWE